MYKILFFILLLSPKTYAASAFLEPDSEVRSSGTVTSSEKGVIICETPESMPYYFEAMSSSYEKNLVTINNYYLTQLGLFSDFLKDDLPMLSVEEQEKKKPIIMASLQVLKDFKEANDEWCSYTTDSWVMSVIQKSDKSYLMRVCVVSDEKSKFTHHIGICQSFQRFMDSSEARPKGLAMMLHGFSADFMLKREPSRSYMVTSPTEVMEGIFYENLGASAISSASKRNFFNRLLRKNEYSLRINGKDNILSGEDYWVVKLVLYHKAIELDYLQWFYNKHMDSASEES